MPLLNERGIDATAITLTGCTPNSERFGTHVLLAEWTADIVASLADAANDDAVVLVGHSQGGLVTAAAAEQLGGRPVTVIYLDAPVPSDGQRGVDLNPPGVPAPPDDLDPSIWLPARPVDPDQGFEDPDLQEFVNARLVPTPLGPSLERVTRHRTDLREVYAFCTRTPPTYPCWSTRIRMDNEGLEYVLIDSDHDAPLLAPQAVADLIVSSMSAA